VHNTSAKKLIVSLLCWCFLPLLLVGAVNLAVDPLDLRHSNGVAGLITDKPMLRDHERLFKPYAVASFEPEALIIGSSRANHALDPQHPAFQGLKAYNLSVSGASISEIRMLFEHAVATSPVRSAVIELDMRFFDNGKSRDRWSYLAEPGRPNRIGRELAILRTAFSWDTLRFSLRTLFARQGAPDYTVDGRETDEVFRWRLGYYGSIRNTFAGYIKVLAPGEQRRAREWAKAGVGAGQFQGLDDLRAIVSLAAERGIDLRLFISPSHALDMETLRTIYGWSLLEDWERAVVGVVEPLRAAGKTIQLWDFSGYNTVTTEAIPDMPGPEPMAFYWDESHYRRVVGNWILDRMFALQPADNAVPAGFGTLLSVGHIEEHLADLRRGAADYRREHRDEVQLVERLTTTTAARAR
jgi:hypothetical protein